MLTVWGSRHLVCSRAFDDPFQLDHSGPLFPSPENINPDRLQSVCYATWFLAPVPTSWRLSSQTEGPQSQGSLRVGGERVHDGAPWQAMNAKPAKLVLSSPPSSRTIPAVPQSINAHHAATSFPGTSGAMLANPARYTPTHAGKRCLDAAPYGGMSTATAAKPSELQKAQERSLL